MPSVSIIDLDIINFDRECAGSGVGAQNRRGVMTVSNWSRENSKTNGHNNQHRHQNGNARRSQLEKIEDTKPPSNQVNKAFRPMRILLQIMGRFPFHPRLEPQLKSPTADLVMTTDLDWNVNSNGSMMDANQNERHSRSKHIIGNVAKFFHLQDDDDDQDDTDLDDEGGGGRGKPGENIVDTFRTNIDPSRGLGNPWPYSYSFLSFHWLFFLITSAFLLMVFLLMSMGFANVFLEWDFPEWLNYSKFSDEEKTLFQENLVPFVLVWSCLLHANVGNFSFIRNRKRVVDYLNEWERVVDTLELKLPAGIRIFLIGSNFWFITFLVLVVIFYVSKFLPVAVGGAKLIGLLCMKPFMTDILQKSWFFEISVMSIVTLVYSMYSSRAFLFVYAYKCRLLKYGFKKWNKRLKEILNSTKRELNDEDKVDEERSCERLYRDHFTLLSMVKHTDKVFGGVLQSYYASQILNMCFELYYLARSGTFTSTGDPEGTNQQDIFAAILLLVQNVSIFFTVSLDAAYVGDEAHRGFEILRMRVTRPHESVYKKYLMSSLHSSFHHRIVMTGGKFFCIDRPFVITVLGAVCTYFVIILQFGDRIKEL